MTASSIPAITEAFEWRPGRVADRTWLAPGFDRTLATLVEHFPDTNSATLWAVALLLGVIDRGGTCLPLEEIATVEGADLLPAALAAMSLDQWRETLRGDAFSTGPDVVRPLVVSNDRLYFDRYLQAERLVADELLRPLDPSALARPVSWDAVCEDVFVGSDATSPDRLMASGVWEQRTYLLAGGPGTGKTTAVAKFLVALARSSEIPATVRLCAPTGKAAQRMGAALAAAVTALDPELGADVQSRFTPVTIHSLLAITPTSNRRRATTSIDADFVICDETSMVDVVLLGELLRALPATCRVVPVGDPHQLQSVDVGSVMSDLMDLAGRGVLAATELEQTHRVDHDMDDAARARLLSFFTSLRAGGDGTDVMAMLDVNDDVLSLLDTARPEDLADSTAAAWDLVIGRARALEELARRDASSEEIDLALNSVMVLCAQHQGLLSRTWWVDRVSAALKVAVRTHPTHPGTPVLVTRSDRFNHLTNGDTGLLVHHDGATVFQPSPAGTHTVALRPTAVQHWQPWWAMTIHKSQGSEFDTVIVSITPHSNLASRELLYTAVTRAKRRVILVGRRDDIRAALSRSAHRYSGLVEVALDRLRASSG